MNQIVRVSATRVTISHVQNKFMVSLGVKLYEMVFLHLHIIFRSGVNCRARYRRMRGIGRL